MPTSIFDFVLPERLISQDELKDDLYRPLLLKDHLSPAEEVLAFWKGEKVHSPKLARMTRKVMGVQFTSVSAERQFSTAGYAITYTRSSLKPTIIKITLLLKKLFEVLSLS